MWRFILVTFVFLGWSFYELSGGSDYEPRTNSIQARALLDNQRPNPRPGSVRVAEQGDSASDQEAVDLIGQGQERVRITLASVKSESVEVPFARAEPEFVRTTPNFVQARPETDSTEAAAIDTAVQAALETQADDTAMTGSEVIASPLDGIPLEENVPLDDMTLEMLPLEEGSADVVDPADIRLVSGNVVNLREGPGTTYVPVDQLSKGTEVEVLYDQGDGWVELRVVESGQIGWIADWLITTAN